MYLVKDAQELKQTLIDLQHKHMVLIDTMGMSQRDRMVEEQVAMFGINVKRLLLLSATGRGDTLDDVRAYGGPDLAGCILSKVDEAAGLASAIDTVIRNKLCLHYVSNGQRVPEDLHLPNRVSVASCFQGRAGSFAAPARWRRARLDDGQCRPGLGCTGGRRG